MFLVDDLLTAPFRGLLWIFREIGEAVEQERAAESDQIKDQLRELYMMLETGRITEAEFDAEEATLLDRLEALEAEDSAEAGALDEGDSEEEDSEEEDSEDGDDGGSEGGSEGDSEEGDEAEGDDDEGAGSDDAR